VSLIYLSIGVLSSKPRPDPLCPSLNHSSILIVGGAGTIGSSTALHLRRRGYTNLKLIDSYPFPCGGSGNSQSAGGSDLNKIVGYADGGVRGELAEETMRGWREDPVFKEHYYEVGEVSPDVPIFLFIDNTEWLAQPVRLVYNVLQLALASLPSNIASLRSEYTRHTTSPSNQPDPDPLEWLSTPSAIIRRAPHLQAESIQGWQGTYRPRAGWAGAMDAIDSVGEELRRLGGVEMVFGRRVLYPSFILSFSRHTLSPKLNLELIRLSTIITLPDVTRILRRIPPLTAPEPSRARS
jgi:sarcosine oxidase/L-pipecolate oxidase